ncbi:MAG: hypothetical protein ACT4OM_10420 [Actinomycetota bacterium]
MDPYRRRAQARLLLLLATCLFTGGCNSDIAGRIPGLGTDPDQEEKTLISANGAFEMNIPGSWRQVSNLNDVAVLQAANRSDEAYAVFIVDPKAPFEGTPLASFAATEVERLQESLDEPRVGQPETLSVGGSSAVQYQVDGKADGVDVIYLYTFVETDDNFLKVAAWSLQDRFEDNEQTLKQVTLGVRQIRATASPVPSPQPSASLEGSPSPEASPAPDGSPSPEASPVPENTSSPSVAPTSDPAIIR